MACATAHGAILQIPRGQNRGQVCASPSYALDKLSKEVGWVRMKSRQAPSANAVRVSLTCVSTSGVGELAIAFMIRFCTVFKNKSVTSKRKRRALGVMIERKKR